MTILFALWLFLPAYVANMAPTFVGGPPPIDGGRVWRDGRRILGDGKTWRGLFLAPLVAAVFTLAFNWLALNTAWGLSLGFSDFGPSYLVAFAMGYLFGWGALVGDAVESFFKRRLGKERGAPWIGFDQLDFVAGAFLVGLLAATVLDLAGVTAGNWMFERWTWAEVAVIVILTPLLHVTVNRIAYRIGKKDVPW